MSYESRPWVKMYEPGVPADVDIPDTPLHHFLEEAASKYPDNIATIFVGAKKTYREINELADRMATALANLGVKKGDVVALLLPNSPQFVIAFYGALKAGATLTLINPLYKSREIEFQLKDSGAKVLIALDLLYKLAEPVIPNTSVQHTIVTWVGEYLPGFKATLGKLLGKIKTYTPTYGPNVHRWKDLLAKTPPNPPKYTFDASKDIAVLAYTGGTTGIPKGAMLTHRNLVSNAEQMVAWLPTLKPGGECFLCALPFFHSFGLTTNLILATRIASPMVLLPRPDINEILKDINKYRATLFMGVPTLFLAVANHPDVGKYDLTSVRYCISGAAPLPMAVAKAFEKVTGANLVEGYGLTEASPVTHCNPLQEKPPFDKKIEGSIGVPMPSTMAKIVDMETGKDLPVGEVGMLVIKGPQVMRGYWNKPEETKKQLRDGWLWTGDIAKMDEKGYFYIVDRAKDMIDRAGFKIYPREVEEVLYTHPAVKEAAVIGVPDPKRGETVKAFIVLKEGMTATEEEIKQFCKDKMAHFKVPEYVEFRDELPKSTVGKILRRKLREETAS